MQRRITLRDVAKTTGYHYSTVSLALRGDLRIPEGTRETVLRAAERLAYHPDPMLCKLAAYRRGLKPGLSYLAYLINLPSRHLWSKEHTEIRFLAGVKRRAAEIGYQIEEVEVGTPRINTKRMSSILSTRGYAGLLLSRPQSSRGHMGLDWAQFSAVKIGHSLTYPRLHCAENNQYQIMQLTIRNLRRKGYERIGLAMRAASDEVVNHWWKAGYLVETDRPMFAQLPMLITKDWSLQTFKEWYRRHKPQVIVSVHLNILAWLEQMGLSVPDDVGFVDLDCNDPSGGRAGIYQHHEQVGAAAIDILNGLILRGEQGIPEAPQLVLIEGKWMDGKTVKTQTRQRSVFAYSGGERPHMTVNHSTM